MKLFVFRKGERRRVKMKKMIVFALSLMMVFVFASCGKSMADSPYVGTWKATEASYSGFEMSVESILGGEMSFELKDNGKCVMTIAGEETSGKWTENEDGFNVADEFDFKVDDNKATMDYSGVTVTLEKQ